MAADGHAAQLIDTAGDVVDVTTEHSPSDDTDWANAVFGTGEEDESADDAEDYDAEAGDSHADDDAKPSATPTTRATRLALAVGGVVAIALTVLVGWLGVRAHQSHATQQQSADFLEVGRQGAVNMTTIDWQHADKDIQRILDSATGTFYDDFSKRSKPFIDVVKKAQSKSTGTVTEAALESETPNQAQVLVAVRVATSNIGAQEQEPRHWRMRMTVDKVGDEMKMSNVVFVP